jgi:glycerophosphoryl diester phosphodiesterase
MHEAGFTPRQQASTKASAECRTSDLTLAEFKTLRGKMDAADKTRHDRGSLSEGHGPLAHGALCRRTGTLMTHAESIALFKDLGVKFTPELKAPAVDMPFDGFSPGRLRAEADRRIQGRRHSAGDVFPQSFNLDDVLYWIENEPEFGKQAVYLDGRRDSEPDGPGTFSPSMAELKADGRQLHRPAALRAA